MVAYDDDNESVIFKIRNLRSEVFSFFIII